MLKNIKLDDWCEHKGHFYTNINKYFTFTKINNFDVFAKFASMMWQTYIGVNTLTPYMSSWQQKQKNMTISHFVMF